MLELFSSFQGFANTFSMVFITLAGRCFPNHNVHGEQGFGVRRFPDFKQTRRIPIGLNVINLFFIDPSNEFCNPAR